MAIFGLPLGANAAKDFAEWLWNFLPDYSQNRTATEDSELIDIEQTDEGEPLVSSEIQSSKPEQQGGAMSKDRWRKG